MRKPKGHKGQGLPKGGGRRGNGHKGHERRKGTGTLEKRGKVYIARWTVDGKRFSRSTGTDKIDAARRKLDEFTEAFRISDDVKRLEAVQGMLGGARARLKAIRDAEPALLLADAWSRFEDNPERPDTCSESTLRQHGGKFARFVEWMAERHPEVAELRAVTREHANEYARHISRGISATTFNITLNVMCRVWGVLADDGFAKLSGACPFAKIAKRHIVPVGRRELTVEEVARIVAPLEGEMRTLFAIGLYTGLRLKDCACLKWENVDMLKGVISVVPAKTKRYGHGIVAIPVHRALHAILSETPSGRRKGFVMPGIGREYVEGPTPRVHLQRAINAVFTRAGIETHARCEDGPRMRCVVGFHSLRHTAVSLMANAGTPLAVVQRIVGHTTASMTAHYYHESAAALNNAISSLPDMMDGGAGRGALPMADAGGPRGADGLTDAERAEAVEAWKRARGRAGEVVDV